ncbi:DUF6502 family protein [Candidatus Deferrimicrobium sp.]|uniref:DUF6502 family protein n=1 Tax=Candidatus Deferrimicrobium sp. TaxID=3060586 RepID=UPI002EDA77F5
METRIVRAISAAVTTLLRPLVRLLLRNGIPYRTFSDMAKRVYVDVAMEEFGIPGRKQSKSRVSIITGLSRKEVLRLRRLSSPDDLGAVDMYNRAARVIGGWVRDPRFNPESVLPMELPFDGDAASFRELVKSYSGDAPARAVLDELLRVGTVERTPDGKIRLLERSYIPKAGEIEKIGILGVDTSDLIGTIDHNIHQSGDPFFQRKVCYDNLPSEALPGFRNLAANRAQGLLEHLDRWLSERDRDFHPEVPGTGRMRAGVGIYYFQEDCGEGGKT